MVRLISTSGRSSVWDEAERKVLADPKTAAYKNVAFFYFVQFVLDRQMQEAHEHAKAKGVILKGDIPIGVNRNGCDVWTEPKYFNLNGRAGAPPMTSLPMVRTGDSLPITGLRC